MTRFTDANIERLFGVSDAENERPERLKEYFVRNKAYENLNNDLAIRILVGHKGSGKSALLKMLFLEDQENRRPAIWLQPGDVLNVFDAKKGSFNSWIEDWKDALANVIVNQIVQEIQPDAVRENIGKIANTAAALLNTVRQKLDRIVSGGSSAIQKDVLDRFKATKFLRVYIDDLDRGWEAKRDDIRRISALLNAIRDLCGSSNAIQFRIGLRTDVYYLVRTSDESTDKIEDKIVWLTWSSHDLLVLFAKRIGTFFGQAVDDTLLALEPQSVVAETFHQILEPVFRGRGKWTNVPVHRILMSLQRKRPRDLVKLLGGAAKVAFQHGHEKILTSDLQATFASYSAERLQDIMNEFGSELRSIQRLLLAMKPPKKGRTTSDSYLFTQASLDTRLAAIMKQVPLKFTNSTPATPRTIGQFLYKIDFIVARREAEDGFIIRNYFDQSRFLFDQNLDFGFSWEVHMAYRWALQPDTLESAFEEIALTAEN